MSYVKTEWKNSPSKDTPISAQNLMKIEDYLVKLSTRSNTFVDFTAGSGSGMIYKIGFTCQMNLTLLSASLSQPLFTIPLGFTPSVNFDTPVINTETGDVVGELAFDKATNKVMFNGSNATLGNPCRVTVTYLCDDV